MGKRIEILWPSHGESEDRAHAKQLAQTTPRSRNCRTLNSKTLRAQGGQRAGYSNFTSSPVDGGVPVDALASVVADLPKFSFTGPGRFAPERVWGHQVPGKQEALDAAVDSLGNIFVLSAAGFFEKIGPDGKVDGTTAIHVPGREAPVPRIELDSQGSVYVATSDPGGLTSRLMRFVRNDPDEDDKDVRYVFSWQHLGLYGIRDFRVRGGLLVISKFVSPLVSGGPPEELDFLGQLTATSPTLFSSAQVPWPVSSIDLTPNGEVLVASAANTQRNRVPTEEGWFVSVEDYSPHELENINGSGMSTRLHFWVDANTLPGKLEDGDDVVEVLDRRWLQTTEDSPDIGALPGGAQSGSYFPPTDTKARTLRATALIRVTSHKKSGGCFHGSKKKLTAARTADSSPPRYRENGAGYLPAIVFEPHLPAKNDIFLEQSAKYGGRRRKRQSGNNGVLHSGVGLPNDGVKSDTDGDGDTNHDGVMLGQGHPIPCHAEAVFATFMVIRYRLNDTKKSVIFHHRATSGIEVALVMNAAIADCYGTYATPTVAADPPPTPVTEGSLSLYIGMNGARTGVSGAAVGALGTEVASCDLTSADFANNQRVAIICIAFSGTNVGSSSMFRVNGRNVDVFNVAKDLTPGALSGFGEHQVNPLDDHFWISGLGAEPFEGSLLEVVTVLGDTATPGAGAPNRVPVSFPGTPTGLPVTTAFQYTDIDIGMGGETYATDPVLYTSLASEVEKMEGYLAYKWGCPNVLKGGAVPDSPALGLVDVHPFGLGVAGGAVTDPVQPVGVFSSGGLAQADVTAALRSEKEILCKVGVSGKIPWALAGGGHGLGVVSGPDGFVFAVGQHDAATSSRTVAKKILDLGPSVDEAAEDTWTVEEEENSAGSAVRGLAADDAGGLYWPRERLGRSAVMTISYDPHPAAPYTSNHAHDRVFRTSDQISGSYTPPDPLLGPEDLGRVFTFRDVEAHGPVENAGEVAAPASLQQLFLNLVAAINGGPGAGVVGTNNPVGTPYIPVELPNTPDHFFKAEFIDSGVSDRNQSLRLVHRGFGAGTGAAIFPQWFSPNPWSWSSVDEGGSLRTHITIDDWVVRPETETSLARVEYRSPLTGEVLWARRSPQESGAEIPNAVTLGPSSVLYPEESDLEGTPEHLYITSLANTMADGSLSSSPLSFNLEKIKQVGRTQIIDAAGSSRQPFYVAAAGGDLYRVRKGRDPVAFTTGRGVLQAGSPYTKLFSYRQKIYGLDGEKYIQFDPKTSLVEPWKAEGAGEIPFGAKLAVVWNGRIVLSRTADDPHNIHMSERGNPDGWDTSPVVLTPLSAFSGASTGNLHFRKNDLVNCLIPARDDLLIIGGDQSISRLTGDPGGGGQLDNLTTSEGLAFGDAYAIGPAGAIYAKGINGGVWRISVQGGAERISLGWIERRLQNIDLSLYDVRMVWSFEFEGLHLYQVPRGVGARTVEHYFWDAKEAAWWTDEFSITDLQPTSATVFDGDDPADRMVVIGCEDGYIRYEDALALNDGGHRIVSSVVLGPFNMGEQAGRMAFSHLEVVLASEYQGCTVQLFVDEVADFAGGSEPVFEEEITPGYTGYTMARAVGNHIWIRLLNGSEGESWSLETLAIQARRAGRRRRMF